MKPAPGDTLYVEWSHGSGITLGGKRWYIETAFQEEVASFATRRELDEYIGSHTEYKFIMLLCEKNMKNPDVVQSIVQCLVKGGIYIFTRGSGKSLAMSQILLVDPKSVVVSPILATQKVIAEYCNKMGVSTTNRVLTPSSELPEGCRIYVDEINLFSSDWLKANFFRIYAACGSPSEGRPFLSLDTSAK